MQAIILEIIFRKAENTFQSGTNYKSFKVLLSGYLFLLLVQLNYRVCLEIKWTIKN